MAKPVQGFLSDDGVFFDTFPEADMHNAEMKIRAFCVTHKPNPIDDERLFDIIEALAVPIKGYLHAKAVIEGIKAGNYRTRQAAQAEEDKAGSDEDGTGPSSIFEQPTDGHEPMPDMGDGTSTESILGERTSDGPRSGKRNARGIRGSSRLAVDDQDETA